MTPSRRFHYLLLASMAMLLLLNTGSATASEEKKPAAPIIEDGETQIVPAFEDPDYWIRHDLWVETEFDSDGDGKLDRMHVDVTRPRQTDTEGLKLHVIYITSPYFAGTAGGEEFFYDVRHELGVAPPERASAPGIERTGDRPIIAKSYAKEWVPRGFAVVHSSSPGTGLSQGCVTIGGDNESLAPKAVIDWLNGRAQGFVSVDGDERVFAYWATGKVGMTGVSFNGSLALAAATTGVDGLEAIIPVAPNTSYYHYYRSNGLVRAPGGWQGEDIPVLYDFVRSGNDARREYCDCNVRDKEMAEGFDRVTGDYNEFWAGRDYVNDLGPLKAATLMSHAFNDWNVMPEHSVRIYEALKEKKDVPIRAYFHQGGHGGPPPLKMMNRWFTRYLHGVKNGIDKEPRAWIVREDAKRDEPTSYKDYPNPDASPVKLHLLAGSPTFGKLSVNAPVEQGKETLVDNFSFSGDALAQAEWTDHRLMYVTPVLTKPVHLSGTSRITIKLASSKPTANLSVWMVSLPWAKGKKTKKTDNIITRGWADPQNYRSLTESEALVPGQFYEMSFDLQPDDQIIPEGQQIGLMIFSSDRGYTLWPDPGSTLTIDLDATSIDLPVVGGRKAFAKAVGEKRKRL